MKRVTVTLVVTALILFVSLFFASKSPYWGTFIFISLQGLFIAGGIRKIEKVHKGIEMFLGERQSYASPDDTKETGERTVYHNEGWGFFPGYPLIFGFSEVKTETVNQDLSPTNVRTPDMAEVEFHAGLTFVPWADYLINYENNGKEEGVKKILDDVVGGAIRTLAADDTKEPKTWKRAVKMHRDFVVAIVHKISHRYDTNLKLGKKLSKEQKKQLNEMVEKLEDGGACFEIPSLGIMLKRLNMLKIHPKGKLADAAEKLAIERSEAEAEMEEANRNRERVAKYLTFEIKDKEGNVIETIKGLSPQEAREYDQTERGKTPKTIKEVKLNVSPGLLEVVKDLPSGIKKATNAALNTLKGE